MCFAHPAAPSYDPLHCIFLQVCLRDSSILKGTVGMTSLVVASCASLLVVSSSHHTELILSLASQETPRGILNKIQIRKLCCFSYSFLQNLKRNHYQITQVTFFPSETPRAALTLL